MRAIVINRCCKAEDLHVSEITKPTARPGWVVVKVRAAGLNHSEAILRMYEADRDYIHTPIVPGIECVGEVDDPSDTTLQKGQRVIALMGGMGRSFNGSYAEYALLPNTCVFPVCTDLSWPELAAIPETYFTAYGSLTECLLLQQSDTLLIRGATSTVGQAAIQLAKALGATVIAAARNDSSFHKLTQIGADYCVVDDENISRQQLPLRPNKVLELVGPKTLHDSLMTVSQPGYVCNTGVLGNVFTLPQFDPIKYIPNGVFLSGFFSNFPTQETIDKLFSLIATHNLHPLYSKVFPLENVAEAHRLLEFGRAGGKIILTIQ